MSGETSSPSPLPPDRHAARIAPMLQPDSLKSDEYHPWSRGRGVDVWAMLCASIMGDLDTISTLVARDPALVECEYEYFKPGHFAVRENHLTGLLANGANPDLPEDEPWALPLESVTRRGHHDITELLR